MELRLSYDMLKEYAIANLYLSPAILNELKNIFSEDIGSVRRRECIRNITELIDCLERRDTLSEYNVNALQEIALHCSCRRLLEAIDTYDVPKETTTTARVNRYRDRRLSEGGRQQSFAHLNGTDQHSIHPPQPQPPTAAAAAASPPVIDSIASGSTTVTTSTRAHLGVLTTEKRSAIYKLIGERLGVHWRRLARELDITEGAMDEIEIRFPNDLSSRIFRMFQLFEENDSHNPEQHAMIICQALDRCKRKDIRRKIEDILSH